MSLWWAKKDQLDKEQLRMIEQLGLRENHLVLGPPGSGKTNVLLRRAQYVRSQGITNVLVLSFTRPLAEFVKTGCYNGNREIFPPNLVSTVESWTRSLYQDHSQRPPNTDGMEFGQRKAFLATDAMRFATSTRVPPIETIFVDEAQDLLAEEVALMKARSANLFLVGDDRQKIHDYAPGLDVAVRAQVVTLNEGSLLWHYRLAPELCDMADKIQQPQSGGSLLSTSHYNGPRPGRVETHGRLLRAAQITEAANRIKDQLRAYSDLIAQGDRLGVIVPRRDDRTAVFEAFEADPDLAGKAQIIKARSGTMEDRGYNPSFDDQSPIAILTEKGCKGLEFRAAHWLFCDELAHYRTSETYYTVVTRPKTRLDLYYETDLPMKLAKSYSPPAETDW